MELPWQPHPAARRVARALASAVLPALLACATVGDPVASQAAWSETRAALDLYEAGEFTLAAQRFARASSEAASAGEEELERKAAAGECLAWIHAQRLERLAECSRRLERLQRSAARPDPGVNTLVALGAIAGARPLPPLRIPTSVRPLVQAVAREGQ